MFSIAPSRSSSERFFRVGLLVTCSLFFVAASQRASAEYLYQLPELSVHAGDSGQIEVMVDVSDAGADLIASYGIQFNVADGVTLTGVPDPSVEATGSEYAFGGYGDNSIGQTINGFNLADSGDEVVPVTDALAIVDFAIPDGTPIGTVLPLEWTDFSFNVFANENGTQMLTGLVDGSITIVPEPSSMALGLLVSSLLLCLRRRR